MTKRIDIYQIQKPLRPTRRASQAHELAEISFPNAMPAEAPDAVAQRFFSLFQAAQVFGKSPRTMRWWADTGRVRTVKIGRARFITEAEIQRLQAGGEG